VCNAAEKVLIIVWNDYKIMIKKIALIILYFTILINSFPNNFDEDELNLKNDGLKGKVQEKIEYLYNIKNLSGENLKELDNKFIFRYNENGYRIERSGYRSDGALVNKEIYNYDEKQNKIEESVYMFDESLYCKSIYKYNENNLIIEKEVVNIDDSFNSKSIFKYNLNLILIEQELYDKNNIFIGKSILNIIKMGI